MDGVKVIAMFENDYQTECRDVVKLIEFQSKYHDYTISLYRAPIDDCDRNYHGEAYYLLSPKDKFPIVVTKEAAEKIMEDPSLGVHLVNMRWADRYR